MKIATFNVNGVNGRLPRLLELKSPDVNFPAAAFHRDVRGRAGASDHAPTWVVL